MDCARDYGFDSENFLALVVLHLVFPEYRDRIDDSCEDSSNIFELVVFDTMRETFDDYLEEQSTDGGTSFEELGRSFEKLGRSMKSIVDEVYDMESSRTAWGKLRTPLEVATFLFRWGKCTRAYLTERRRRRLRRRRCRRDSLEGEFFGAWDGLLEKFRTVILPEIEDVDSGGWSMFVTGLSRLNRRFWIFREERYFSLTPSNVDSVPEFHHR